jgi:hypothetical protein
LFAGTDLAARIEPAERGLIAFEGPIDESALEEVEQALQQRGSPAVQVEISCLAEPGIAAALTRRGYALEGFENVLGRALDPGERRPGRPGVDVSVSPPEELGAWLDVVVAGFASPDAQGVPSHESFPREALEQTMSDMAAAEGFVRYAARRDGRLAGGARGRA